MDYTPNYDLSLPSKDDFYNIDTFNNNTTNIDTLLKNNANAAAANATAIATKQAALGFTPENVANKGANNGYCPLDAGGKIPSANLPSSLLQYQSTWDASTNTPTLTATAATKIGYYYKVTVAGTQFGIEFHVGDWLIYNTSGAAEKSDNSDEVTSVNGQKGAVTVQDVIPSVANRLFYGSGTAGALNQLGFPSTTGSFLRQDTAGAPFFSTPTEVLTAIGAQKNLSPVNSTATSISVPAGTGTVLKSQSLSAGTYLLFGYAQFPNNSTGVRGISISTSSTFDDGKATKTPACNGWETAMTCWFYLTLASTTTVYLAAYQNSGSTLTVSVANFLALKVA